VPRHFRNICNEPLPQYPQKMKCPANITVAGHRYLLLFPSPRNLAYAFSCLVLHHVERFAGERNYYKIK
jgi:hypothetical protein